MNERIDKLPKWARDHIKHLEIQRDTAVKELELFRDEHNEGNVVVSDLLCTHDKPESWEFKFKGRAVTFHAYDVEVEVSERPEGVAIRWDATGPRRTSHRVPIVLESFQRLLIPEA